MDKDNKLILEAMYSEQKPVTKFVVNKLQMMLNHMNEMSTAISLSRSQEIDQLLSKIRDLSDMLITDKPQGSEDSEMAVGAELPAGSGGIQPRLS